MDVVVVGGGAAGFFAALSVKEHNPECNVTILEKADTVLSKVKISGGGRCNVTHSCFDIPKLVSFYPRGGSFLKKAFHQFQPKDTIQWFEDRNVRLMTQPDNRIFPQSGSSQTIIDCFLENARKLNIHIQTGCDVTRISFPDEQKAFEITVKKKQTGSGSAEANKKTIVADKVIITTGGLSKNSFLFATEIKINNPVASLFSFNINDKALTDLMGLSFPSVSVKIPELRLRENGDMIITHWGLSGPAVLKISSVAARALHDINYRFKMVVNWSQNNAEIWQNDLFAFKEKLSKQKIKNHYSGWSQRFWVYLLTKANLDIDKLWRDLSKKEIYRLVQFICHDEFLVEGKTTFKEEFVTCGGVDLSEIHHMTMESKKHKGLYFAGEVLDIDGVTGGFNFQAAWTTGYIAGQLMS
ncbi:MAG: NAD(P)/FAD-dependent oxidoreductase [Leptospirales bacterium]